jgi:hypothetical protein
MNVFEDELGKAIEELCAELFSVKAIDDAEPILRAAASLIASSRTAQASFGRALVADQVVISTTTSNNCRVNRLQLLVERFLYNDASSLAALALLSALAHENIVNQRRIARHVPGVCISSLRPLGAITSQRLSPPDEQNLVLLVLSLPQSLRAQFKQWRRRHRLLRGHRVPTGDPPSQDGVPAPCFCNDCLGSHQHLATWADHYHDMTRWTLDDEAVGSQSCPPPQFSGHSFLQQVLDNDYRSMCWPCGVAPDRARNVTRPESDCGGPRIYFFLSAVSADKSNNERLEVGSPDPLRHVCAIEIDPSIARFVMTRRCRAPSIQTKNQERRPDHTAVADDAVNRIVLLRERVPLQCTETQHILEESTAAVRSPRLAQFAEGFKPREGGSAALTASELQDKVNANHALDQAERTILCIILQFLEPHVPIPLTVLECALFLRGTRSLQARDEIALHDRDPDYSAEMQICDIRISATLPDQSLEIVAQDHVGIEYSGSIRATALPRDILSEVVPEMCALDDESLRGLLQFCRLCRDHEHHSNGHTSTNSWLCLVPVSSPASLDLSSSPSSLLKDKPDRQETADRSVHCSRTKNHARGLSPIAERSLNGLGQLLASNPRPRVADAIKLVRKVVYDCNDRIMELSADGCDLTPPLREAARERCRMCRDLLVQAGKRLKLSIQDEAEGTLSDAAATRLKREIDRILRVSDSSDAWEASDPRVQQLHLSRREWASGMPDPEFFVNRDARSRFNRLAQRHLNKRLVDRARRR